MIMQHFEPITITDQYELFLYMNRYNFVSVNLWIEDVLEIDKTLNENEAREVLFLTEKFHIGRKGFTVKEIKKWIKHVKQNGITITKNEIQE